MPLRPIVLALVLGISRNGSRQDDGAERGRIFDNLAAIGLGPADIDAIVISHTHPDHVGNLRAADGSKAFPRAAVFVPKAD